MKIRIWSDFACPFCYIGETSLLRAVSELGIKDLDLEFKSFELDPDMPEGLVESAPDHFMRVAGLSYEHAMGRIAKVSRFARMAGLYLTQRVKPLYHGIEHRQQVGEAVKTLYILLCAVFSTDFNYSFAVKRFHQLSIYRLSEEITPFAHG